MLDRLSFHGVRHSTRAVCMAAVVLWMTAVAPAAQRGQSHQVTGLVVEVRAAERQLVVSHDPVPGLMPAMIMPFDVRSPRALATLAPGAIVRFTLRLEGDAAYADDVEVIRYESVEQDPLTVRRLRLLRAERAASRVAIGAMVPDFTLTSQKRERVSLSRFRGRVVALNFIYTSCALPQFCYRMTNHFGQLQNRFAGVMGKDLVLLTITFDPVRDTPERLAAYAEEWKANPAAWHFLTGPVGDIERVAAMFGLDYFPDEGLINHDVRTAVIGRDGRLLANIEGNRFTARQLGDLVESALRP